MELKKAKSRNLSVYQFFQLLQVEWIVADLRSRIYPNPKDKEYWKKVKEGKAKVIESIAEKNHLPTIFTDEEMKRLFDLKVYNANGVPNFLYKDDSQRAAQEPLDLTYYYSKGAEVRFEIFGVQTIGKVLSYVPYEPTVIVEYINPADTNSKVSHAVTATEVTRIL